MLPKWDYAGVSAMRIIAVATPSKGPSGSSVMPDVFNPPSVIPDVFNRESMVFPMQSHPKKGTEEKDAGFPLTTCGNDRGGPAGITEGPERA